MGHDFIMKRLLIVGAGGHGQVVREIAVEAGYQVDFLDDKPGDHVVGGLDELDGFADQYDCVLVGIGNNATRQKITERIECLNVKLATLIHPTAYISPSATIGEGTVIEPKAIVNTNSIIGKGCIISVGAIVDHDVNIGDFSHVNAGAICKGGSKINAGTKLEAGEVVHGFN